MPWAGCECWRGPRRSSCLHIQWPAVRRQQLHAKSSCAPLWQETQLRTHQNITVHNCSVDTQTGQQIAIKVIDLEDM